MGKTEQKKYSKEIEAIVENMSLMDDDLMARVFDENIPATQLLLRTILSRDVEVIEAKGQWNLKNPLVEGRNIRLDVFAKDVDGTYFDCEVQRKSSGASPRRVRFHSAMLDARMLESGKEFNEINDSYVIFITESDYYRENEPIYNVKRFVNGKKQFEDGNHIVYVNGAYESDDALGRLLKDMKNKDVTGFYNEELEKGVRQFKDDKEGKNIMCEAVENYAEQYAAGKYDSGKSEGKIEAIRALMKNLKLSAEQAMESIGIPKSEYNKYMSKL